MAKRIILGLIALLAGLWMALVISQHALLIRGSVVERGPFKVLACDYFTGTRVVRRERLVADAEQARCRVWLPAAKRAEPPR